MGTSESRKIEEHTKALSKAETPQDRAELATRLLKVEKSEPVRRVLAHVLKYSEQEVRDGEFSDFIAKRQKRRKTPLSPQEVSRLRAEFDDTPRSKSVRRK